MKNAFSLIELLVVIAIIALLAAVAVPAYSSYTSRVQIANIFTTLSGIQEQLMIEYAKKGAFPATASYGNVSIPAQAGFNSTTVNRDGIASLGYQRYPNEAAGFTGVGFYVLLSSSLNSTCQTPACRFYMVTVYSPSGANTISYCGVYGPTNANSPINFLPQNCNCTRMDNVWNGSGVGFGAGTNGC